jgi:hypothetical protein
MTGRTNVNGRFHYKLIYHQRQKLNKIQQTSNIN